MSVDIKYLVDKRKELASRKDKWNYPFQILGKYIYAKKQAFQQDIDEGAWLNDGMINDSTAARANSAMVSAIMGALWKSGGRTFRIRRPRHIPNTTENNEFYMRQNEILAEAMESPKAGFENAFHEELMEEGAFGTSAIALFKGDYENPLIFKSWSIQNIYIAEGPDGFVDTVYYDMKMSYRNLKKMYPDSIPKDLSEKAENVKTQLDKVLVCVAIEPRDSENKQLPVASYHFLPEEPQKILKESGYSEMPVRVSRWYKLANEEYGRSSGMDALPAIMQLNAFRESFLVGVEKKVDPPLYVLDDGSLGAGVVDTSARGLSVFNSFGKAPGQAPIGTIFDVGELQSVATVIEETKQEILQHFLIDRLYDLNNKSRMTLGEAEMRYQIRSDALSSVYARKTAEILNPLIIRSYNILFEMGLLGVNSEDTVQQKLLRKKGIEPLIIPPDVAKAIENNQIIYEVDYISPAANVMREEEYRGNITTVKNIIDLAGVNPEAMDILDVDTTIKNIKRLTGASPDILRGDDDVKKIREDRNRASQKIQETALAEAGSKAIKNAADAKAALAAAGGGGNG